VQVKGGYKEGEERDVNRRTGLNVEKEGAKPKVGRGHRLLQKKETGPNAIPRSRVRGKVIV